MVHNSKLLGNEAFRSGNYKEAIRHYTDGLLELCDEGNVNERYTCLNNRSQCYLKINDYQRAFDDANAGKLKGLSFTRYICLKGISSNYILSCNSFGLQFK
jgi:hypothetical protein